jgi:hypothetical protein
LKPGAFKLWATCNLYSPTTVSGSVGTNFAAAAARAAAAAGPLRTTRLGVAVQVVFESKF